MAKAKTYKRKIVKEIKTIEIKAEKGEVLRRTFKIENKTDNIIERAGYVFKPKETIKLYRLTLNDLKEIKTCKSLKII